MATKRLSARGRYESNQIEFDWVKWLVCCSSQCVSKTVLWSERYPAHEVPHPNVHCAEVADLETQLVACNTEHRVPRRPFVWAERYSAQCNATFDERCMMCSHNLWLIPHLEGTLRSWTNAVMHPCPKRRS